LVYPAKLREILLMGVVFLGAKVVGAIAFGTARRKQHDGKAQHQ
jgi:hypothetical protein